GIELVAGGPSDDDLHSHSGRRQRRADRHGGRQRLRVPRPGENEPLARGLMQLLSQSHGVSQRLTGMAASRLEVDDRLLAVAGETANNGVLPSLGPILSPRE